MKLSINEAILSKQLETILFADFPVAFNPEILSPRPMNNYRINALVQWFKQMLETSKTLQPKRWNKEI